MHTLHDQQQKSRIFLIFCTIKVSLCYCPLIQPTGEPRMTTPEPVAKPLKKRRSFLFKPEKQATPRVRRSVSVLKDLKDDNQPVIRRTQTVNVDDKDFTSPESSPAPKRNTANISLVRGKSKNDGMGEIIKGTRKLNLRR